MRRTFSVLFKSAKRKLSLLLRQGDLISSKKLKRRRKFFGVVEEKPKGWKTSSKTNFSDEMVLWQRKEHLTRLYDVITNFVKVILLPLCSPIVSETFFHRHSLMETLIFAFNAGFMFIAFWSTLRTRVILWTFPHVPTCNEHRAKAFLSAAAMIFQRRADKSITRPPPHRRSNSKSSPRSQNENCLRDNSSHVGCALLLVKNSISITFAISASSLVSPTLETTSRLARCEQNENHKTRNFPQHKILLTVKNLQRINLAVIQKLVSREKGTFLELSKGVGMHFHFASVLRHWFNFMAADSEFRLLLRPVLFKLLNFRHDKQRNLAKRVQLPEKSGATDE